MTDIALGKPLSGDDIRGFFDAAFASLVVAVASSWEDIEPPFDVAVVLHPNESEFPCGLEVTAHMQPGRDFEAWLRGLAKALGDDFGVPAFCDGTPFGDTPSPYWGLVWDGGEAYLADDLKTKLADGEGGHVKIVRKLVGSFPEIPDRNSLCVWVQRHDPALIPRP